MAVLTQIDNPVLWQEFTHQERSGPRWMRRGYLLGILIVVSSILYVVSLLPRIDTPSRETALFVIWVIHTATVIRAIVAGANAISREHVGQTWDALILTGVSARVILVGKWRAALWRIRGWTLALGVIRLVMLPVFVISLLNRFAYFRFGQYSSYYSNSNGGYYNYPEFSWVPAAAVLAVIMTVVLTLLEVGCCTALGLAASAIFRRGSTAAAAAIIVRFLPVALFAAMTRYDLGPATYRWWRYPPLALADGGTSPLYQLVLPLMPWTQGRHIEALLPLAYATLLLVGFLMLALIVTLIAVRRTGALPHAQAAPVGQLVAGD